MKRLAFVLITGILLVSLSGSCWADTGFWFGPKGLYFHPSDENIQRFYKTFWGWGGEAGWSHRHMEVSLEASYFQAKGKLLWEEFVPGEGVIGYYWEHLSAFSVAPRVAFRLRPQHTPYAGIGVGYHKMSWGFQGLQRTYVLSNESSSAMSTELFAGYDYRLVKWCGARGELGYRMPEPVERDKTWLYAMYKDMRGWKASLGVYLSR